jgi:hypothetical protein
MSETLQIALIAGGAPQSASMHCNKRTCTGCNVLLDHLVGAGE